MPLLSISETARRVGLRASAIRYYERAGLLSVVNRAGGKRRYDDSALSRLNLIQFAKATGFTLSEIRELLRGFPDGTPPSKRWQSLAQRKLLELDALTRRVRAMQRLLREWQNCRCLDLDECGRVLARMGLAGADVEPQSRLMSQRKKGS